MTQLDRIFSQLPQERIRRMSQRFHPGQIAVHDFGPGLQLASQARHPIRPIFTGGILPSPDSFAIAARDSARDAAGR